jgi:septal ring factor EnvC (AmiA/AmiB activator)
VIRFACLTLLIICLTVGIARADQREDLAKLRLQIAALQQNLEKTSESKSEVADALRESEQAISNSNRRLAQLAQQQQTATHALTKLQQQSAQLKNSIQGQQTQLAELLYQQYLEGQQEYLQLLLNNRDPNQTARDLQYYEYIARSQAALLAGLRKNLVQMDKLTHQTQKKSQEIKSLQDDESSQRQLLVQDRRDRQKTLRKISVRLKQQNREIGRLQRNENRLSQLVEKLPRIFNKPGTPPFEALKGELLLPVRGRISNKFGVHRPDGTALWKGWFLRAREGQKVRAVAAGRVVFADWLRGYGNLLIIDHGKGYMSLYGDNETLYKQVGDTLQRGDVIATVGNSGGHEHYGLYFELRYQGIPIDPAHWIAVR